jgi:hypothetical protein
MKAQIRRHLSFANVTSLMALFFAMGGTGYALTIPRNSVGTKQIKKGGVANSDMRTNAVTGSKVKNRSLLASDFALGQLPTGPAGATGAAGPTGSQGATGVVGAVTVARSDFALEDGATSGDSVPCPAGTRAIGGGSSVDAITSNDIHATVSRPDRTGVAPVGGETFDGWRVTFRNPAGSTGDTTVHVFAVCAET